VTEETEDAGSPRTRHYIAPVLVRSDDSLERHPIARDPGFGEHALYPHQRHLVEGSDVRVVRSQVLAILAGPGAESQRLIHGSCGEWLRTLACLTTGRLLMQQPLRE
jgi:hypothetical protein